MRLGLLLSLGLIILIVPSGVYGSVTVSVTGTWFDYYNVLSWNPLQIDGVGVITGTITGNYYFTTNQDLCVCKLNGNSVDLLMNGATTGRWITPTLLYINSTLTVIGPKGYSGTIHTIGLSNLTCLCEYGTYSGLIATLS